MKLLFTDLDGTLLNNDSMISDYTKQVLDRWTHAGNKLILTSGRPLDSILQVKERAGLIYPGMVIIANNGSLIYDCDSCSPLLERRIPMDYVNHIMNVSASLGIHCQTYTDTSIISTADDEELAFYRQRITIPYIVAKNPANVMEKEPFKLMAIDLKNRKNLEDLQAHLMPWSDGKIQSIFSNDRYLEFITWDSGKGKAVQDVCTHFHSSISDAIAAGDMDNDISMITAAGIGIAMKNAAPGVKEAASVITEFDNHHDGLAKELERYL